MTKSIPSLSCILGIFLLVMGVICPPVQGQAIEKANSDAIRFMRTEKWPEAHAVLKEATDTFDSRGLQVFGPRFGWFWYHRGLAAMKLNKFEDAVASFEKCAVKYKNLKEAQGKNISINAYEKKALLLWGHAAKATEQWQVALDKYKQFLAERDPSRSIDSYNKGVFFINRAICNYKLNKLVDGNRDLETAIEGKISFPTPNKGIMSAFSVMVETTIKKQNEKALLDFIGKNRAAIKLEPFEAHEFSGLFMKLAQDAKNAEMTRSSFELYALVPSTIDAIDDIRARLTTVGQYERTISDGSMSVRKSELTQDLADLEEADTTGKVNEIYAYLNNAVLHEDNGNVRGAFAVYEQLELYFPNAKIQQREGEEMKIIPARERNLFNLVRTSALISEVYQTEKYGRLFLDDFPESEHADEVRRLMLTSLFFNGEYVKCEEIAGRMIDELKEPSEQHDICLFVLSGSKHYLGKFYEAQPLLDKYLKLYRGEDADETRLLSVTYFQAANESRLGEWEKSAALLDSFLKKYPEPSANIYYPFALYDRSNCHYSLTEYEPALEKITRVEKEFPGVSIMESAFALKGNILQGIEDAEGAEIYYKKALELAEQKKNDLVAGEALFSLVALIGQEQIDRQDNPRVAEAVPYYQQFWDKYGENSPYKARMAVAGIPGMAKVDKLDEALERLQGVIADFAKSGNTDGAEEAINSYTDAYLRSHTPEELKDHYYDFPRIDSRDKATRALLRIAVIGVYEQVAEKADPNKEADKIRAANARVQVLFTELRTDFDPKDLSNFILVRVGNFIRKTNSPTQAKPYFEAILNNENDDSHRIEAIFGLADVLGKGSAASKGEAITLLKRVIADSEDKSNNEEALYLIAQMHFDRGEYGKASEVALNYIKNKSYRQFKLPARMLLAQAYDKGGKPEDAMGIYAQVWGAQMGNIKYSAPAIYRWMEMVWRRNTVNQNGKSDRQFAYEKGHDYARLTASLRDRMSIEEKAIWDKVQTRVNQYEADASTTPIPAPAE